MEKRLFSAIILSVLVLIAYSALVNHFAPQPTQPLAPETAQTSSQQPASSASFTANMQVSVTPPSANLTPSPAKENLVSISDENLVLSVNLVGSGIAKSKINFYNSPLLQSNIGSLVEWSGAEFSKKDTTDSLTMSYSDMANGLTLNKQYKFTSNPYIVEMSTEFINFGSTNRYVKYNLNLGSIDDKIRKENPNDERYLEFFISLPDKTLRNNFFRFNPKIADGKINWLGIRDRYFCSIVKPLQDGASVTKVSGDGLTSYLLEMPAFELSPGQKIRHSYLVYLGPQNPELIANLGDGAEQSVNFGALDSLSHILLGALRLLYKISKNWGLAIILFSLLVFVVLSPLSIKSFTSMKKMQELQPVIEELKVKYKDSPQKMQKEMMGLYREKKINPFGGCLPLLLQMPIFIALYQTMMRFVDLKSAGFLWIKDLADPDRLFMFKQSYPVIGNEFNLLPIIMTIIMLIQQKMSTAGAMQSAETAKQQKLMGLFMAVFFGVIFYKMPSGLVLYWTFNSILMLIFQARIMKSKA